jgi:hypothetical protein
MKNTNPAKPVNTDPRIPSMRRIPTEIPLVMGASGSPRQTGQANAWSWERCMMRQVRADLRKNVFMVITGN